jgi:hypothetical protein
LASDFLICYFYCFGKIYFFPLAITSFRAVGLLPGTLCKFTDSLVCSPLKKQSDIHIVGTSGV